MTGLILDASVAIAAAVSDEEDALADAALDVIAVSGAFAPVLWWAEIRNVLLVMERRQRLRPTGTAGAIAALSALPISLDDNPDSDAVMTLARAHVLSVYDALYLELAIRLQKPLATLDRRLTVAARDEGMLWEG